MLWCLAEKTWRKTLSDMKKIRKLWNLLKGWRNKETSYRVIITNDFMGQENCTFCCIYSRCESIRLLCFYWTKTWHSSLNPHSHSIFCCFVYSFKSWFSHENGLPGEILFFCVLFSTDRICVSFFLWKTDTEIYQSNSLNFEALLEG